MTYAELLERTGLPAKPSRETWPAQGHAAAMVTKLESSGIVNRARSVNAFNEETWYILDEPAFERRCERRRAVLCQRQLTDSRTRDWDGDGRIVPARRMR